MDISVVVIHCCGRSCLAMRRVELDTMSHRPLHAFDDRIGIAAGEKIVAIAGRSDLWRCCSGGGRCETAAACCIGWWLRFAIRRCSVDSLIQVSAPFVVDCEVTTAAATFEIEFAEIVET